MKTKVVQKRAHYARIVRVPDEVSVDPALTRDDKKVDAHQPPEAQEDVEFEEPTPRRRRRRRADNILYETSEEVDDMEAQPNGPAKPAAPFPPAPVSPDNGDSG